MILRETRRIDVSLAVLRLLLIGSEWKRLAPLNRSGDFVPQARSTLPDARGAVTSARVLAISYRAATCSRYATSSPTCASIVVLRTSQRVYQSHAQGIVTTGILKRIAATVRQRISGPSP